MREKGALSESQKWHSYISLYAFSSLESMKHLTCSHLFTQSSQEVLGKKCWHPFHRQQDSIISPKSHLKKVLILGTSSVSLNSKTIQIWRGEKSNENTSQLLDWEILGWPKISFTENPQWNFWPTQCINRTYTYSTLELLLQIGWGTIR